MNHAPEPDSGTPTASSSAGKHHHPRLTLAIALVGAVTGVAGAAIGCANYLRSQTVDLRLSAPAYTPFSVKPIQVDIVNRGQRATSVVGGEVWLDGTRQGTIDRVLLDARHLQDVGSLGAARALSHPLPVDLPAGASDPLAVVWEFDEPYGGVWDRAFFDNPEGATTSALRSHTLEVRLKFDPGDWRTVKVPLVPPVEGGSGVSRVRTGWELTLAVHLRRVTGALIFNESADPALVRVKLWRGAAPNPVRQVSRPISEPTIDLRLGDLRPGKYWLAATADGEVVATASFRTPCRGAPVDVSEVDVDACYVP
jgi:hypothetical protein